MSFAAGLKKQAADPIVFSGIGKALARGLKGSGESTIKDAVKLKGLKHIKDAVGLSGGLKKALTSQSGRERLAEGVGKAAPSLAAGGVYAAAGAKAYKKLAPKDDDNQGYY